MKSVFDEKKEKISMTTIRERSITTTKYDDSFSKIDLSQYKLCVLETYLQHNTFLMICFTVAKAQKRN